MKLNEKLKKDTKKSLDKIKTKDKPKKEKVKVKKKGKVKKVLKIILLIILILFIIGVLCGIGFIAYIVKNAPEFNGDLLYVTDPTIILDKDGNEIAKLGAEKRITITYDELPEVLIDAIVATEDSRFFEHNGVDWARFLKASALQLMGKNDAGGASTLTMQISKNTYTSNEASGLQGIIRKFTDVYVSLAKIEKNYTKEQIMEFYVNSYYLGNKAYGVEQAAQNYFGKSAKELNVSEAAMIAGLFQAPGNYNPYKNPEKTEKRRQLVLKLMLRHGYINKQEYEVAKKLTVDKIVVPLEENSYATEEVSEYQGFIDAVAEEVEEKTGYNPYTTSMIIHTTMDKDIQNYVNDVMNGVNYDWENDVVQAGVAIVNVKNGSVAALGAGRNIKAIDTYNYATDLTRQIGSTAKPLYDYGPAIEYNNLSSGQVIVDEPITYSNGVPINNWNGTFEGMETMRVALRGSRNIPALKTFKANNKEQVTEFVTKLGLTPEVYSCDEGYRLEKKKCIDDSNPDNVIIVDANINPYLHEAHSIGGYNGESPLSMAAAYAAFANKGVYNEPYTFTKLIYQETGEEFVNDKNSERVMSEETAYIISDMLVSTAIQAMGRFHNINGVNYAAKTGTTNYDEKTLAAHNLLYTNAVNDLWTIGYNTEYALGVWYGYDKVDSEYYNRMASGEHERLFQAVGKKVFTNGTNFEKPAGVVSVTIEKDCPEPTLPSEYTPADLRITELFIRGTEPTTVSPRFQRLSDVSNLKASENNGKITLTWNTVKTPEINTEGYLRNYYANTFSNSGYLNSYIGSRMSYINNYMGTIGYNIYEKDASGNLTLLNFVTNNNYEITVEKSGNYTYVVKTSYSIFKNNMSGGKSVSVSANVKPIEPPVVTPDPSVDSDPNSTPSTPTTPTAPETPSAPNTPSTPTTPTTTPDPVAPRS